MVKSKTSTQPITALESRIAAIEQRNARVEADKAWETSWARTATLALLTYFVVLVFFLAAGFSRPYLNAFLTSLAFILSTLTLPAVKRWWLRQRG